MSRPFPFQNDLALVRAALAGQEAAIEEVSARLRCVSRIITAQNHRLGKPLDASDVADVVQETVLVLLRKLDVYAGLAPLERWIYRICELELQNGIRRKRRARRLGSVSFDENSAESRAGSDPHLREEVRLALTRLRPLQARIIHLKHFEGLTFDEIGTQLGLPTNTVKTSYYRCLAKLERYLRPRLEQGDEHDSADE